MGVANRHNTGSGLFNRAVASERAGSGPEGGSELVDEGLLIPIG